MTRANITDTPIKVVIADLKSKYSEIEQEKDGRQFFIKIAQYGKYILENRSTTTTLTFLYQEAKDDAKPYLKAWKDFVKVWKQYARDILKKASEAGIKDNPNNPLSSEIGDIKNHLNDKDTSVWETDLQYYYIPYMTLIWKFNDLKKSDLLVPKHLDPQNNTIVISPMYDRARDEWDKFKVSREAKVWWAHYQVCRLAAGVLGLKIGTNYFKRDNIIDGFYKYEFNEMAKGNLGNNPIVLHADKYAVWIKRLHKYLLPRLQELSIQTSQEQYRPLEAEIDLTDTSSRRAYEKKWDVLQAIWEVYESQSRPDSILIPVARLTIKKRDVQLIDGIVEGLKKEGLFQKWDRKNRWYNLEFFNHERLPKVYQEVGNTYKKFAVTHRQRNGSKTSVDYPSEFLITVKDREIRINNYLIAKPHAVGSNYDFFEYIQSQPANKQIERKNLSIDLQEELGNKTFFKILNALGFKGEIKRAFFYKVDANTLCYRGDKLTLQQLKEAGINTKLFIKELETADAKYNPD